MQTRRGHQRRKQPEKFNSILKFSRGLINILNKKTEKKEDEGGRGCGTKKKKKQEGVRTAGQEKENKPRLTYMLVILSYVLEMRV